MIDLTKASAVKKKFGTKPEELLYLVLDHLHRILHESNHLYTFVGWLEEGERKYLSEHSRWRHKLRIKKELKPTKEDYSTKTRTYPLHCFTCSLTSYTPITDTIRVGSKVRVIRFCVTESGKFFLEEFETIATEKPLRAISAVYEHVPLLFLSKCDRDTSKIFNILKENAEFTQIVLTSTEEFLRIERRYHERLSAYIKIVSSSLSSNLKEIKEVPINS